MGWWEGCFARFDITTDPLLVLLGTRWREQFAAHTLLIKRLSGIHLIRGVARLTFVTRSVRPNHPRMYNVILLGSLW